MNNEVKTDMTSGQAFQLFAAIAQQVSRLGLSGTEAQRLINNRRLLQQRIGMLCNKHKPTPQTIVKHCELEDASVELLEWAGNPHTTYEKSLEHAKVDWRSLNLSAKTYPGASDKGRLFFGTFSKDNVDDIVLWREFLGYEGRDCYMIDVIKRRNILWSVYEVLWRISRERDYERDPLGLAEFEFPARAVFPIFPPEHKQNHRPNDPDVLYLLVYWDGKIRGLKSWNVEVMHSILMAGNVTVMFRNDPRIDSNAS